MQQPRRGRFSGRSSEYKGALAKGALSGVLGGATLGFMARSPAMTSRVLNFLRKTKQRLVKRAERAEPPTPAPVTPREPVKRIYTEPNPGKMKKSPRNFRKAVRREANKKLDRRRNTPIRGYRVEGGKGLLGSWFRTVVKEGNWQERLKKHAAYERKRGRKLKVYPTRYPGAGSFIPW